MPALVVTPLRDLMYQWQRRIRTGLGFEAGVLGDGRREVWPITVTTYDSAWIHMKDMGNRYRLVVYDEAHHLPAPSLHESALDSLAPMRLGLTATPQRADGRDSLLADLIGPVVYQEDLADARGRTVADYAIVRVPIHLTEDEQATFDALSRRIRRHVAAERRDDPDFDWTALARRSRTDPEAKEILRAWRHKQAILNRSAEKLRVLEDIFALHPAEPVVVFTASNRMALDVSARFLIPALTAHSDKRERNLVLDGFARGAFPALAACQVLNEGWDAPAVKVGVVLGGDRGVREAVQRLGRILRRSGDRTARLYEVYVQETADVARARRRGTRRMLTAAHRVYHWDRRASSISSDRLEAECLPVLERGIAVYRRRVGESLGRVRDAARAALEGPPPRSDRARRRAARRRRHLRVAAGGAPGRAAAARLRGGCRAPSARRSRRGPDGAGRGVRAAARPTTPTPSPSSTPTTRSSTA